MKTVLERLLDYVRFDTTSNETTGSHPSTPNQMALARHLAEEMRTIGILNVNVSEHGYVTGEVPATPGLEHAPALGFIAHVDTSDAASGADVKPQIVSYRGGIIPLGTRGKALDPCRFPFLSRLIGHTLITTDGTTLLGADDKAGIAEIMTAAERIIAGNLPHGPLRFGFTPDEEIGEGTLFFDVKAFDAEYAYTVDGGAAGEIEYQNFNAATATVEFHGVPVHPGSAKGIMVNALRVAFEFNSMLPQNEVPEQTEQFQGFYHLIRCSGTASEAQTSYLLRDHDAESFDVRKTTLHRIAAQLNARYGAGTVTVAIKDQYRNMEEVIQRYPFLLEIAGDAVRENGLEPVIVPIRGGTDGAMLSFRGLPCPNLGTGGYNFHGESEFASVDEMEKTVGILLGIIARFSRMSSEKNAKSLSVQKSGETPRI